MLHERNPSISYKLDSLGLDELLYLVLDRGIADIHERLQMKRFHEVDVAVRYHV